MSLAGKRALVTGVSGGIGGAIAQALAAAGAEVHALGRSDPGLAEVAFHRVALEDEAAVLDAARTLAKAGPVDLLIHSAGAYVAGPVAETSVEDLDRMMQVNFRAPWLLTRALLPHLTRDGGWVVFVNSSVWDNARGGTGAYAASKYALKAFADTLRGEVNALGIRVLSVYPGRTASGMQASIHQGEGKAYAPERLLQPGDVADSVLAAVGLPMTAEVTDIHVRPGLKPA